MTIMHEVFSNLEIKDIYPFILSSQPYPKDELDNDIVRRNIIHT